MYVTVCNYKYLTMVTNVCLVTVCKYLVTELQDRLDETGKTKEILRTGHGLDRQKKERAYHVS